MKVYLLSVFIGLSGSVKSIRLRVAMKGVDEVCFVGSQHLLGRLTAPLTAPLTRILLNERLKRCLPATDHRVFVNEKSPHKPRSSSFRLGGPPLEGCPLWLNHHDSEKVVCKEAPPIRSRACNTYSFLTV